MKQKTVIITGANSGIGKAASLRFAKEGCTVIMACRNMEKSKRVQNEIVSVSKNNKIYLKEVDMSSFISIRAFCGEFKRQFQKLDILINNAAYINHGEKYKLSPDNIELTFATNVFGPFLMTELLLGHLKKSEEPRILNASSNIIKHFFSPKKQIEFDNLQGEMNKKKPHSVYESYCQSKMALLMLTFKMAEKYKDLGITVNSLQINGARMSEETIKKFKPQWRIIAYVQNMFFPSPEFMANHYFDICTLDKFRNITGKQINHKQEIMQSAPMNPKLKDILGASVYPLYAHRSDISDKIWNLCLTLTDNGCK
jgi:NAD(P)-dependent dehydrogenase (short-subunit alcohol dehydrogenase family)